MGPTQTDARSDVRLDENLAAAWLTHTLSPHTRVRLAELGSLVEAEPNQTLMREGEPSDFLAIVLEGRVALRVRVPERGPITVLTVEPGDVLGWSAVVPPYRATSSAIALTQTELAYFDGPTLREALATDEALAAELYPVLLSAVARRLEGTRLQLLDLFSQRWVEPW
jgi:CRP-like cAMP-binding protein